MSTKDARTKSQQAVNSTNIVFVTCAHCNKEVTRRKSFSDFRLKDADNKYIRFCEDCKPFMDEAIRLLHDPTGLIFQGPIEVGLGERDPFFRIKYFAKTEDGTPPGWKVVKFDDETGGLLIFIRKATRFLYKEGESIFLKCGLKIMRKSQRVGFAEPIIEEGSAVKETIGEVIEEAKEDSEIAKESEGE